MYRLTWIPLVPSLTPRPDRLPSRGELESYIKTVLGRLANRLDLQKTLLTRVDTTTAPLEFAGVRSEIIRGTPST